MTQANKVKKYLSLVKFSHTIFAMPFAITGFVLGIKHSNEPVRWSLFILVVLAMVFARNAAMAFNRWADRELDKLNPRTALREIPAGIVSPGSALFFVVLNSILFVSVTFFINKLTFYLSPIALIVILGYSLTKKFTSLCHFILGIGLSLAPIGAYLSVTGSFDLLPVFYSILVLFWVSGFDMLYALQDEEFDQTMNLKSMVVNLGKSGAIKLSVITHAVSIVMIFLIGFKAEFGLWYWLGSFIFAGLLAYQHMIIKPNDISRINLAFATTNGIASIVFAVFNITEILFM
ncbi:MAG: putative 4-hydroxybenzoate polyprenyltransferase [Bacteroidales bacterium]|nr:putative 4-hydroxybenzoate polyprenyltransferase [Bacteroidales bacterium]MCF8390143.1 putative 4-hydroxybenzoate polyprenyltransferase [Bacteroidales bacterium]